jgi:hypothetical protein
LTESLSNTWRVAAVRRFSKVMATVKRALEARSPRDMMAAREGEAAAAQAFDGVETRNFPNCDLDISPVPLRRVVTRSSSRIKDKFCSRKMGCMIPAESSNEYACLVRAELDPTVTHVFAQALDIHWRDNLGWHRHWPDVVTVRHGRVEAREVKPDLDAETECVRAPAALASRYCAERGAVYHLDLESSLKAQPTCANALEVLYRTRRFEPNPAMNSSCLKPPPRSAH